MRRAVERVLAGGTGGLLVVGDPDDVLPLCDGGFRLDEPFTPEAVAELAKMDGAVIVDSERSRIVLANAHLVPDRGVPTTETGSRHRTAQRVSAQTTALVIAMSRRRGSATVYVRGQGLPLTEK